MPFTFVQKKSAYTGGTTSTLTTDSSVTANNFLVVFVQSSTLGSPTISSSPSTTWTQIIAVQDSTTSNSSIRAWWAIAPSSAVMTVTLTSPANDSGIDFFELDTGGIRPILDNLPAVRTQGDNGNLTSYTLTTFRNNTAVFSSISDEPEVTASGSLAGANETLFQGGHSSASAVILDAGTAGDETITWTWSGSQNNYATVAFAFYLPPSGTSAWLRI